MRPLKQLLKDGWDAPINILVVLVIVPMTVAMGYSIYIIAQVFIMLFVSSDFVDSYAGVVIALTVTFLVSLLSHIPIYKVMHRNNYLHYCKSFIIAEFVLVVLYMSLVLYPIL